MRNLLCAMPQSRTEDKEEWVQSHSERLSEGPCAASESCRERWSARKTEPQANEPGYSVHD